VKQGAKLSAKQNVNTSVFEAQTGNVIAIGIVTVMEDAAGDWMIQGMRMNPGLSPL
jgi:hypothetical protein